MARSAQTTETRGPVLLLRSLTETCRSCPSQWEGMTEDGRAVYVRYRWGYLSVGVGRTLREAVDASCSDDEWFGVEIGGGYSGDISEDDMLALTGLRLRASSPQFGEVR